MNNERTTVNLVVAFLGLVVLVGMGIGGYLAIDSKAVPDFIVATTAGAIGALSALLSRTSTGAVTIDQPRNDPIPVADVGERGQAELLTVLVVVLVVLIFLKVFGVI